MMSVELQARHSFGVAYDRGHRWYRVSRHSVSSASSPPMLSNERELSGICWIQASYALRHIGHRFKTALCYGDVSLVSDLLDHSASFPRIASRFGRSVV